MDDAQNPRLPSDLGLPALGVIMQGVGAVTTGLGALFGVIMLVAPTGFSGGNRLASIGFLVLGLIRGFVHQSAGREVARRSPQLQRAVRTYLITAGVATVGMAALLALMMGSVPATMLVAFAVAALGWPVALAALVFRPIVKHTFAAADTFDIDLAPRDRSIEGIGVLMIIFGAIGLAFAAIFAYSMLSAGPSGLGIVFVLFALSLVARSVIHIVVGLSASRGMLPGTFQQRVFWYFSAALVSVGLLVLGGLVMTAGRQLLMFLLLVLTLGGTLLAWPLTLRNFAQGAVMTDIAEDDDGTVAFGPAPDRGLTAFGYWLIFFGSLSVSLWLAQLLLVGPIGMPGLNALGELQGADIWLTPLHAAAALWAGIELIRMSPRFRQAMIVYGVVALIVPILGWALGSFPGEALDGDPNRAAGLISLAVSLVMPIMAFVLAARRLPGTTDLDRVG